MINVIMHGCNGAMGRVVCSHIHNERELSIVAGIDVTLTAATFPVFANITECDMPADVIIDFSVAHAVPDLISYARAKKIPIVVCTTGLDDISIKLLNDAASDIPVFLSANMSLGINLLAQLAKTSAKALAGAGFDIEVTERHHNKKLDAPSGTAFMLANAMNSALEDEYTLVTDRYSERRARTEKEIGLSAIRGGNIVGEHTIIFAGKDEIIEITHKASSKDVFANGAIEAAKFLVTQKAGKYDMTDVLESRE